VKFDILVGDSLFFGISFTIYQNVINNTADTWTIEDLLPDLSKANIFSVVDAKNGFWHVELDDESSYLTMFNTPFGRYRWLRMRFGISSAPEEYQRRQDQTVEGLPGGIYAYP
jgi:hypothetical protein